jgi:hypothetical protein
MYKMVHWDWDDDDEDEARPPSRRFMYLKGLIMIGYKETPCNYRRPLNEQEGGRAGTGTSLSAFIRGGRPEHGAWLPIPMYNNLPHHYYYYCPLCSAETAARA